MEDIGMSSDQNDRLARLEMKIDRLTEAMVSLARSEEKIQALESEKAQLNMKVDKINDRLDKFLEKERQLEARVTSNERVTGGIMKILWLVASATVGIVIKLVTGMTL